MIFLKLFSDLINRIEERSGNKLELPSTLMLVDIHAALDKPNNCKILSQSKSKSKVQSKNSKVKFKLKIKNSGSKFYSGL